MWSRTYRTICCTVAILLLSALWSTGLSQSKFYLSGYVKDLFSHTRVRNFDNFTDNLLHHRLNAEWFPNDTWTFKGALRTRLFVGDQPATPFFLELLELGANDYLDLSVSERIGDQAVVHSYLDRLYVEYTKEKWQLRLGRQRINWGIHTTWNPNDLFNAFAFTDFDYEERPGSDALSVKYYTGAVSSIEFVVQAFDRIDQATIAGLWKTNRWNYDFQMLGGVFLNHLVLGGGWAGNIGNWGFKGEFSTFTPFEDEERFAASGTLGWDYIFKDGLSLTFSGLYNSNGRTKGGLADLFAFELSAQNLYPFRWALLIGGGMQLHPLVTAALTTVYSPASSHPLFISPAVTWSIAQNLDLDVVGQLAFNRSNEEYISPVQAFFLRIKWSY